ncbi:Crp/Fnr family transcriptional regulator [candidate division WWE3 bacterium]|nr:Crp/Fnr family transcriptional regulator [candidate division WWE3 bacterium]
MQKDTYTFLNSYFEHNPMHHLDAGDILVHPSNHSPNLHFLVSGTIKQYSIGSNGEELVITVYKPGSFFPLMTALGDIPNRYYFSAPEESEVRIISVDEVKELLQKEPTIMFDLIGRLLRGMHGIISRLESIALGDAHARVGTMIAITAKRFGKKNDTGSLEISLTHQEIAAATGLNRETVTRVLRHFKEMGYIDAEHGHLYVRDISILESLVAGE